MLLPRDRVAVRQLEIREDSRATDDTHRFQLSGEPVFLRIQVLDRDQPLAGQPFTLSVGGLTTSDVVPADGIIEAEIPARATAGVLTIGVGPDQFQATLKVGALHPVETATGVQQRLQNLGFDCGKIDGIVGPRTRGALRRFQEKVGVLPADGRLTLATREQLRQAHGC